MKLFLAMMLVLAVAVVPALAGQHEKGGTPGAGSGTSEPSKPAEGGGKTPSASPGAAPSASPGEASAPTNKGDCKDWSKFSSPKFKDQAECVSFVEQKGKSK